MGTKKNFYASRSSSDEEFGIEISDQSSQSENSDDDHLSKTRPQIFAKGDIKMLDNLGEGGFGQVYKVEVQGKIYAAKVFKIKGADANGFNFLYESSVFSQILHFDNEFIIRLIGIEIEYSNDDTFFAKLVMDLCENGTIDQYIKLNRGKISVYDRIKWSYQVASGLKFLHENNIIHCDLKPANVLLDKDLNAKIIDFGISK